MSESEQLQLESEELSVVQRKADALRFVVGDKVECRIGNGWSPGTVVALLYRDDNMAPGMVAPYQIQLEGSGNLIFAPADDDRCVRILGEAYSDGDEEDDGEEMSVDDDEVEDDPHKGHKHGNGTWT